MQIRSRLTILFTIVVSSIVLLAFITIYISALRYSENQFYERLREKAITTADLIVKVDEVDLNLLKKIDQSKQVTLFNENVQAYNKINKQIYTNNDTVNFDIDDDFLSKVRVDGEERMHYGDYAVIGVYYTAKGADDVIVAGAIDIYGHRRMVNLRLALAMLFVSMIGITALAGWFFTGRALKPIAKVVNEVESISAEDLSKRLQNDGTLDEIGRLVLTFNKLLERIENAFQLQKLFVSNASHELKNPLTKVTSQLEVSLLQRRREDEYRKTINSVLDDIKDLNQLSNNLLDLAKVSSNGHNFSFQSVRLDEVLWEIREEITDINLSYRISIQFTKMPEEAEKLFVYGNKQLIKAAISNIIENACKYSTDGKASVIANFSRSPILIQVNNQGTSLSKTEIPLLFEPFYRGPNSAGTNGHGIGLSLSERIISLHKGKINLRIDESNTISVTIYLDRLVTSDKILIPS